MKKKTLQIVITIPKLFIEGDYKTNSQLAVVTVKGEGPFTANLTKVTGDGRATIKAVCKDIAGYDTKQQVMMVENELLTKKQILKRRWDIRDGVELLINHLIKYP